MHTFYFPMMHLASVESSIIVPSDHVIVPTLLNVLFILVCVMCVQCEVKFAIYHRPPTPHTDAVVNVLLVRYLSTACNDNIWRASQTGMGLYFDASIN